MNKRMKFIFIAIAVLLLVLSPAYAERPTKDIGEDYPDAILWGNANSPTVGGPFQTLKGDIDGNGIPDLIFTGSLKGTSKRCVGVFFDATLSSLSGRSFSDADFTIITQKKYPWASDVIKFHPMHWIAVNDLNQDGFDDIVFGLPIVQVGDAQIENSLLRLPLSTKEENTFSSLVPVQREEKGEVYIVLGNTRVNLGSLRDFSVTPPDFTFFGKDDGDRAGFSVATGDVNGDGKKDILIGAPFADGPNNAFIDGGEIYAITHMDWSESSMVLTRSNVDLYIYGEAGQKYGYAITTGNLNGDYDIETGHPIDDIIVAPYFNPQAPVKVIFGKTPDRRLSTSADWTSAYNLIPRHPNLTMGDLDGNGVDDLVSGDGAGTDYINYGSSSLISTQPDVIISNSSYIDDGLGYANYFSDFDGDGFKDLAILCPRARGQFNQYGSLVGEAHVVWGQTAHLPSVIDLKTEATHFTVYGSDGTGPTGLSSNFQGPWNSTYGSTPIGIDLDGDGESELFFGGSWHQNTYIYKMGPDSR